MNDFIYPFKKQNNTRPMTILEQRFMETMPNILSDLVDEVKKLRKEMAELKEQLKKDKPEE